MELSWTELSKDTSLVFLLLFILFIALYYKKNIVLNPQKNIRVGQLVLSILLIVIVSASSGSDWFSYQQMVWNYDFSNGATNYGEPVYGYIARFTERNYLLFRLIVWGGAFLCALQAFKRMRINVNMAAFMLIAAFLLRFNYARASLGMAIYFLGLSFLISPYRKKVNGGG